MLLPRASAMLAALLLLASGCSSLSGTDDANFVVGDGSIVQIAPANRGEPLEISGPSLEDDPIDLADLRGGIVVLNVWGSWCTPCRAEAPVLREASEQIDAAFVGLSFRETSFDNARSFEREYGITYPTIADTGAGVLALGRYAPKSPPTTYLLDAEGRIAALITGAIPSAGILEDLVEDVKASDEAGNDARGAVDG